MKIKTTVRGVCLMLMALLVAPAASHADALQHIPGDAVVVIKINNLQRMSQKTSQLMQQLGIAQMAPQFADPLGALQRLTGADEGLRTDGDLAFAVLHDEDADEWDEPPVLVLIPVTDYQAFLNNFEQIETQDQITEVLVGEDEEPAYVARRGEYAAMSPSRELLAQQANGVRVEGLAARELNAHDAVFFANFEAFRPRAIEGLNDARAMFLMQMEAEVDDEAARFAPLATTAVNHIFNLIESFLAETRAVTYGLTLTDAGVNTTLLADFKEGTEFARAVGNIRNSDESMLKGLPQEQYLIFGGSVQDPAAAGDLLDKIVGPLIEELEALGDDAQPLIQYIRAAKDFQSAQRGQSFGLVAPRGPLGQESLIQAVAVIYGDAEKLRQATQQMFDSQRDMMRLFDPDAAEVTTTITANARTVDGVVLDRFETEFDLEPDTPAEAAAAQIMSVMYGAEGLNGYLGTVDGDRFVSMSGGSDALLQSLVAAAKQNAEPMAQAVAAVSQQLPDQRAAVVYLPLDVVISTAVRYAEPLGFPVAVQVPPNLPPIGVTVASEQQALRIDSHVPVQLVQSMMTIGIQIWMGIMQQGFAPPPGAL